MDTVRLGLSLRALRRRRAWTQSKLADRAGTSQSAISRIERGEIGLCTIRTIHAVAEALGARLDLRILWQGEGLDRLLDQRHAALVDSIVRWLTAAGWIADPEVTYSIGRERGSIDVLAWHPASGLLLVVEVKSVVPDIQAMLVGIDRKTRVAGAVARERGWPSTIASRMLVLPDERTCRRRLEMHAATFAAALPLRTAAMKRWVKHPIGRVAGVVFLSSSHPMGVRQRIPGPRSRTSHAGTLGS